MDAIADGSNATTAPGGAVVAASEAGLRPGQALGRFTLQRLVGAGAIGEVWAARDTELGREVALKLLRFPGSLTGEAAVRLRREAQAMARLHHRNVVAIYELGTDGDRVFCTMELIDGATLRRWLETPRRWREVLEVALAAGTGVAAAHAAGLVHRDIKPENLLIDAGGRAVVSDFGLARLVDVGTDDVAARAAGDGAADAPLGALTMTGAVLGTPRYMAPEQLAGRPSDARSDQFSYCVTVYEALFGARPFAGDSLDQLAQSIARGAPRPARLGGVPAGVARCLLRGLAADPAARWPQVADLVTELRRAARRPRQLRIGAAVLGVALAVGIVLAVAAPRPPDPRVTEREAAEQQISAVWSPAKAQALATAFAATQVPLAGERAAAATRLLDQYRASWLDQRLDAWADTQARHTQGPADLALRIACYDRLADTMNAVVAVLLAPGKADIGRAPQTVGRLEPVEVCRDLRRLVASSSTPATPAGQAVARQIAALSTQEITGHSADAFKSAQAAVADAERVADPTLLAQARFELAYLEVTAGRPDDAAATLRRVVQEAAAIRDHYLVARAWVRLLSVTGFDLQRLQDAEAMLPAVQAAVAQAGSDPFLQAELASLRGFLATSRDDYVAARDASLQALALYIAARGPEHSVVANAESNLGSTYTQLGELDEANRHLERARAIAQAFYGNNYPTASLIEYNLAEVAEKQGDPGRAERHLRAALAINVAVRRPDHVDIALDRVYLAKLFREQKRFAEAHAELDQVRASYGGTRPAGEDPIVLELHDARLAEAEGRAGDAVRFARQAVDQLRRAEVTPVKMAEALGDLARLTGRDRPRDALAVYAEAVERQGARKPRDVAAEVRLLTGAADAALRAHRPAAALAWFDRMPEAARQLPALRRALAAGQAR